MIKQKNNSKVLDMVEEELLETNKIKDNSKLLKKFYELKYPLLGKKGNQEKKNSPQRRRGRREKH